MGRYERLQQDMIVAVDCRESALDGPFEQGHSDGGGRHLLNLTFVSGVLRRSYGCIPSFLSLGWIKSQLHQDCHGGGR